MFAHEPASSLARQPGKIHRDEREVATLSHSDNVFKRLGQKLLKTVRTYYTYSVYKDIRKSE